MTFQERISATIQSNSLLSAADKVIVGLSGGADSIALLTVMTSLGYNCVAAHCNFGLRGEESERDMLHSQSLCRKLNVKLFIKRFDLKKRCHDTGESIEMACRELRYRWFDELLASEHANAVAVGHHREDNVETILLNLFRGTGISGLCGIRYKRDYIIRPLLDVCRDDIEAYLSEKKLDFIVDSSNLSCDYSRNRIRNLIVPEILRSFPMAEDAILATSRNLNAALTVYNDAIEFYRQTYVNDEGSINVLSMQRALGISKAETVLFELLKTKGINFTISRNIINSASQSGLTFGTKNGELLRLDRGVLYYDNQPSAEGEDCICVNISESIKYPVSIRVTRHDKAEFNPERNPSVVYLDITALENEHSWALRRWKTGDRIKPFGMKGSKLISDIFTDAKFNARQKSQIWILTCDDEPVWIVGIRTSRLFRVTSTTKEYLKLELISDCKTP